MQETEFILRNAYAVSGGNSLAVAINKLQVQY